MKKSCGVLVLALSVAVPAWTQDLSKVEITATRIGGSIYLLQGGGANVAASVGPDGVLLVDDKYAPVAGKLRAKLKELGGERVRFIVNTHWHLDHTGGNEALSRDAVIVANANLRERLASGAKYFTQDVPAARAAALPTLTYDDTLAIYINGEEVRVRHLADGHTDGDSVVFFGQANVVAMGDLFFNGMFPGIHPESGGGIDAYIRNVEAVLEQLQPDTTIVPGHGPLATSSDLRAFHRMLVETTALVRARVAAGNTLEQAQAAGLPQTYQSWAQGYFTAKDWIEILYLCLTERPSKLRADAARDSMRIDQSTSAP